MDIFIRSTYREPKSQEALMIVDMQLAYLPESINIRCSTYAHARKKLVKTILGRIEEYQDDKKDIIVVNSGTASDKEMNIQKALEGYPCTYLYKQTVSLLNRRQGSLRDKNLNELNKLSVREIEVVGVHASACVMQTAISLQDNSYDVKVNVRGTLNNFFQYQFNEEIFRLLNTVSGIASAYRNQDKIYFDDTNAKLQRDMSHLLDLPNEAYGSNPYLWEL